MSEVHWSTNGLLVRCGERGFGVSGAGFYVWDEQLDEALEQAALIRNRRDPRPHPPAATNSAGAGGIEGRLVPPAPIERRPAPVATLVTRDSQDNASRP